MPDELTGAQLEVIRWLTSKRRCDLRNDFLRKMRRRLTSWHNKRGPYADDPTPFTEPQWALLFRLVLKGERPIGDVTAQKGPDPAPPVPTTME